MGPNQTSFRKGSVPWNKGIKKLLSEKSLATAFKKGMKPDNFLEIGSTTIRIDKSGKSRRWIKVSNDYPRWLPYAQWLWTKTHGEIENGLLVHHKDGDSLNDTIENYQLVTRSEHINIHRSELLAAKLK